MYKCACGRTYTTLPVEEFIYADHVLRHAAPPDGQPHDYVNTGESPHLVVRGVSHRELPDRISAEPRQHSGPSADEDDGGAHDDGLPTT